MFADTRFGYLEKVRFTLGYATTPIYFIADVPTRISLWMDDVLVSRTDLIEENNRLREELLVAQQELQLLESLASENSRLLALDAATEVVRGDVLPAEIINVSSDPNARRVLINKGAEDGVYVGQALLDANGLMGQVDEVLPFTSWVLLVTDFRHITPVEVNRNGERALARGSRSASNQLELEFVTQTQDMQAGDLLVSSGMGQVYPKNYPVAEVVSVYTDPGQEFATVLARPLAQLASTRHVMLVFPTDELQESAAQPGVNGPDNGAGAEFNAADDQPDEVLGEAASELLTQGSAEAVNNEAVNNVEE
jgi:rod shape-determining protein MreC